jgi:hypothetical protein
MRGDFAFLCTNCGLRNCGWLGSFQIDHSPTAGAVAAPDRGRERLELLRARLGDVVLLARVAHFGTGPVSVSWTAILRAAAAAKRASSEFHVPAG